MNAISNHSRQSVVAGAIGNVMEWFDFAVYGYFAPVIGKQFFPSDDPVSSLLAAFGAFAAGFLARPIGSAFFGRMGDRHGRRSVLRTSVCLMGTSTLLLGLLPTYSTAGVAAPILLVLLRIAQGFSVGGEFTGSIIYMVERAPMGRRGFIGAWANFGATAGFLLGSGMGALLSALCSDEALLRWGWRLPFLFGVTIAAMAFVFRRGLEEDHIIRDRAAGSPVVEALRTEWRTMLRIGGIVLMSNVAFYMMFVYITTFLSDQVGVPMAEALEIDTVSMIILLLVILAAGWLSDRVGRKPVLLAASIGCFMFAIPLFMAIEHPDPWWIFTGQCGFALLVGLSFGTNPATLVEITGANLRCSTISIAYNMTLAIFGGTTPIVAAWLISRTDDTLTPAYYVMGMAVITTAVVLSLRETAHQALSRTSHPESSTGQ